jgi:hypothetical protein
MKKYLVIVFLVLSGISFSQSKKLFINHLFKNNLTKELEYTLFKDTLNLNQDSLNYFRICYNISRNEPKQILHYVGNENNLIIYDTVNYIKMNLLFLQSNDSLRNLWFVEKLKNFNDSISTIFKEINTSINDPKKSDTCYLPKELHQSFLEYVKFSQKKPLLSSFYSMLVPGLGKFYNGRKYSFKNVFAAHLLLGAKFIESTNYLGIYNPYSIITVGFFSIYYSANIVGAYFDLKEVKKEKKTQFILDVKDYYLHTGTH